MYTLGMEEEYFVFDAKTRHAVRRANKKFLSLAQKQLGDRVMTEMLQSQIEVATPPCASMAEARAHLAHYRRTLGQVGCRAQARHRRHGHLSARLLAGADGDAERRATAPSWTTFR